MKNKKKKGFTLVELIIVIAIIGILAAIAIPKYNTSKQAAAETAHKSNVQMLHTAALVKQNELTDEEKLQGKVKWTKSSKALWQEYIETWPQLPNNISYYSDDNLIVTDYSVTITPTEITVDPDENSVRRK